jgi:hypothetical protein
MGTLRRRAAKRSHQDEVFRSLDQLAITAHIADHQSGVRSCGTRDEGIDIRIRRDAGACRRCSAGRGRDLS